MIDVHFAIRIIWSYENIGVAKRGFELWILFVCYVTDLLL
jgi:hypothetical protein